MTKPSSLNPIRWFQSAGLPDPGLARLVVLPVEGNAGGDDQP
ncbi:MAG: hypothetical protein JWM59_789 [Verrucomicrobiales bacterium]|nr:hypothetical protein [Verrucomicrobiales bacterium]